MDKFFKQMTEDAYRLVQNNPRLSSTDALVAILMTEVAKIKAGIQLADCLAQEQATVLRSGEFEII